MITMWLSGRSLDMGLVHYFGWRTLARPLFGMDVLVYINNVSERVRNVSSQYLDMNLGSGINVGMH